MYNIDKEAEINDFRNKALQILEELLDLFHEKNDFLSAQIIDIAMICIARQKKFEFSSTNSRSVYLYG